ncbi:hypothetical protein [Clostridium sp.]|uniref:hypothetical protein n=1 Tax=Clostridium sp. TaxID=1506 RepID=UPI001B6B6D5E|nr:hypothetical protein [Clostridium sp.]MBP3915910.1 hypothetical protein [Clostridium sp.]MBP3928058.1 hypothetical protein [Peptostreptococcaceae bacterium]
MATLKNLVNETTNIKNELKTCHTNLKNNLSSKGVECSATDKMSTLIDKVSSLKTISKPICGDNFTFFIDNNEYTITSIGTKVITKHVLKLSGDVRVSFYIKSNSYLSGCTIRVRNGDEIKFEKYVSHYTSTYTKYSFDIIDVKEGYLIEFEIEKPGSNAKPFVKECKISCDIDII